jgi:hypothetical protein
VGEHADAPGEDGSGDAATDEHVDVAESDDGVERLEVTGRASR